MGQAEHFLEILKTRDSQRIEQWFNDVMECPDKELVATGIELASIGLSKTALDVLIGAYKRGCSMDATVFVVAKLCIFGFYRAEYRAREVLGFRPSLFGAPGQLDLDFDTDIAPLFAFLEENMEAIKGHEVLRDAFLVMAAYFGRFDLIGKFIGTLTVDQLCSYSVIFFRCYLPLRQGDLEGAVTNLRDYFQAPALPAAYPLKEAAALPEYRQFAPAEDIRFEVSCIYLGKNHIFHLPAKVPQCGEFRREEPVTVLNRDGVLLVDDAVLSDSMPRFTDEMTMLNSTQGLQLDGIYCLAGGHVVLSLHEPEAVEKIPGLCVPIDFSETHNFAHFYLGVMPRVLYAAEQLSGQDYKFVFSHDLTGWQKQLLAFYGIDEALVHICARPIKELEKVYYPVLSNFVYFSKLSLEFLKSRGPDLPRNNGSQGRKIYILRKNQSLKVLLNEQALVERLTEEGFEVIAPETLSIEDQANLFAGADVIVGFNGGAFANAVHCRQGTKIIPLFYDGEPGGYYFYMFHLLGLPYCSVACRVSPQASVPRQEWEGEVDPEDVISAIDFLNRDED